jgi:hypothetical protein
MRFAFRSSGREGHFFKRGSRLYVAMRSASYHKLKLASRHQEVKIKLGKIWFRIRHIGRHLRVSMLRREDYLDHEVRVSSQT